MEEPWPVQVELFGMACHRFLLGTAVNSGTNPWLASGKESLH